MTAPAHPVPAAGPTKPVLTASSWLALAFVAVFCYLDWITHREAATTVLLGAAVAGVIVYRRAPIDKLNLGPTLESLSPRVKPILAAIPGVAYFLLRGQGTSGAGGFVFVSMGMVVGVSVLFGPLLDEKLAGFYASRNRVLPKAIRMVLAIVVPVLVAFLIVHGTLSDLPALFGGSTNHPSSPAGLESRFLLATTVSAAATWLLLREAPAAGAANAAAATSATSATSAGVAASATAWRPTHTTPPAGLSAWPTPAGTAAGTHLDGGLPVQVVARSGDWAQVVAGNGWTGWVDGRLLIGPGS
jgi:hypothetical protein